MRKLTYQNAEFAFRMSTELREKIERVAEAEERTLASVIRHALKLYVRDHDPDREAA